MNRLTAPLTVDINITNQCNLKCPFCSASSRELSNYVELPLDIFVKILDQLESMGVFVVRLAGGEPLLHSQINDILYQLQNRKFEKIILSNGTTIDKKNSRLIKKSNIDSVALSIDGCSEKMHDCQRGKKGVLRKVIRGIEWLKSEGVPYSSMTVITKNNVDYLVDIASYVERLGFRSIKFLLLANAGRAKKNQNLFPSFKSWSKNFITLTNYIKNNNLSIPVSILPPHEDAIPYEMYFPLFNAGQLDDLGDIWKIYPIGNPPKKISCSAGKTQMSIFENGDIYGCDLMKDNAIWKAGNVFTANLQDIWLNSKIFNTLCSLKKEDLEEPCKSCEMFFCTGGCRASVYNATQKINGANSSCWYMENRK